MCWTFLLFYRDRYPQCNCAGCKAVIAGDPAPRAVSSFRLAHDARHHGRRAMEGQLPDFMVVSVFCALLGSTLDTCCVVRCTGLERETQPDVRVHSSSCGVHRVVVHSPFGWLDHRCHCYVVTSCSSSAVFPAAGVFASRCRVVVDFSLLMVLTILFGIM